MNNLALFVTHNIFLTKNEIDLLLKKKPVSVIGCSTPVWVEAGTGITSEPGQEIFCRYKIKNENKQREIKIVNKKQYEIYLPNKTNWKPPIDLDFEKISLMKSEERVVFMKKRDKWWHENPRPQDINNLKNGYLRFEIKKTKRKINDIRYAVQHIIEIREENEFKKSLTT